MRKTCWTVREKYGKVHEVILQDMKRDGKGKKGGLQWHKVDAAAQIQIRLI